MFGIFKADPVKKLEKEYNRILEKAVHAQRNGNIELYSKLSTEANGLLKQIEKLEAQNK